MSTLPEPLDVAFEEDVMKVTLADGRTIAVPLARYPILLHATPDQRMEFWLSPDGVHWDGLDEDISVEGMLAVSAAAAPRRAA